jgi:hypothetical protein
MKLIWLIAILVVAVIVIKNYEHYRGSYNIFKAYSDHVKPFTFTISSQPGIVSIPYQQKIPLKIIQTGWSKSLDLYNYQCCTMNHHMNPEYEYHYFDDKDCTNFIKEHFPDTLQWYNKLVPGAYKADLFRLLALKKMGGVYLDLKTTCFQPLRNIITEKDEFISIKDTLKGSIYNGIMACVPDHPVIDNAIKLYIENIKNKNYGINPLDIGGPQTIGRALNLYLGKDQLAEIEENSTDSIRMVGKWLVIGKDIAIFTSFDEKTLLFNRTCPSYSINKIKQMLKGKEYHTLWLLKKVYSD